MPDAPVLIVNPTAGGGRAARLIPWLRERLAMRPDAQLVVTARRGDAEASAAEAAAGGVDRVIAVGGDGTVQEVVNGLCEGGGGMASMGVVPVGTGNDLARSLALPRDAAEAWTIAIGRSTRRIDVWRATNGAGAARRFASAGGIGFDAQVAAAMAKRSGWQATRAGYLLTAIAELRRFENRSIRITLDDTTAIEGAAFMLAFANGPFYGGGMRIAPDASVSDGLLDVCLVGDIGRFTALGQVPNLYRGTHVRHSSVSMHRAAKLEVIGHAASGIHLDGEPFGGLPLQVSVEPGQLEVAAPA